MALLPAQFVPSYSAGGGAIIPYGTGMTPYTGVRGGGVFSGPMGPMRNVTPAPAAQLGRLARMSRLLGPLGYTMAGLDIYDAITNEQRQAEEDQRLQEIAANSSGDELFSTDGFMEGLTNPFGYFRSLGGMLGQAGIDSTKARQKSKQLDDTKEERLAATKARMAALQEERLNNRLSQLNEDYDPTKHDMYGTGLNDDYDPTKHDMYGTGLYDDYDPTKHDMYGSGEAEPEAKPKAQNRGTDARRKAADAVRSGEAEAAPPVAERISPEELEKIEAGFRADAMSLFKNTHGGDFDPKSDVDERKLQNMVQMFREDGGVDGRTANQVALEFYRRFPNRK